MASIDRVDVFVLRSEAATPYLGDAPDAADVDYFVRPPWRSLYSHHYESVLVRLTADDGTYGWGEALAPVGPQVVGAIVEHLLGPQLLGRSSDRPRVVSRGLAELMRERGHLGGHQGDATAACDIALWDLHGRASGQSIAGLLGGAFRTTMPTYVSGLPRPDDASRADLAADWVARGAGAIKLALGTGVERDLATFDAVRAAAPDIRLAVDAHWAYGLSDALALGHGLDERGAWFFEAPMVPEDVEGHRRLQARLILPVAIGESLRSQHEFTPWLRRDALRLCQPDIGRTGITEGLEVVAACATHHLPVAPHHSVGLGIALAAGLHVAAVTEDLAAFEFQPTTFDHANGILATPITGSAATLDLPAGSGLGVEVDLDAVHERTLGDPVTLRA